MIVRIIADNQYRIDDAAAHAEIDQLDSQLLKAVEANDARAFHDTLSILIEHVRRLGQPVPATELVASDVIVPPADITLAETRSLLLQTVESE